MAAPQVEAERMQPHQEDKKAVLCSLTVQVEGDVPSSDGDSGIRSPSVLPPFFRRPSSRFSPRMARTLSLRVDPAKSVRGGLLHLLSTRVASSRRNPYQDPNPSSPTTDSSASPSRRSWIPRSASEASSVPHAFASIPDNPGPILPNDEKSRELRDLSHRNQRLLASRHSTSKGRSLFSFSWLRRRPRGEGKLATANRGVMNEPENGETSPDEPAGEKPLILTPPQEPKPSSFLGIRWAGSNSGQETPSSLQRMPRRAQGTPPRPKQQGRRAAHSMGDADFLAAIGFPADIAAGPEHEAPTKPLGRDDASATTPLQGPGGARRRSFSQRFSFFSRAASPGIPRATFTEQEGSTAGASIVSPTEELAVTAPVSLPQQPPAPPVPPVASPPRAETEQQASSPSERGAESDGPGVECASLPNLLLQDDREPTGASKQTEEDACTANSSFTFFRSGDDGISAVLNLTGGEKGRGWPVGEGRDEVRGAIREAGDGEDGGEGQVAESGTPEKKLPHNSGVAQGTEEKNPIFLTPVRPARDSGACELPVTEAARHSTSPPPTSPPLLFQPLGQGNVDLQTPEMAPGKRKAQKQEEEGRGGGAVSAAVWPEGKENVDLITRFTQPPPPPPPRPVTEGEQQQQELLLQQGIRAPGSASAHALATVSGDEELTISLFPRSLDRASLSSMATDADTPKLFVPGTRVMGAAPHPIPPPFPGHILHPAAQPVLPAATSAAAAAAAAQLDIPKIVIRQAVVSPISSGQMKEKTNLESSREPRTTADIPAAARREAEAEQREEDDREEAYTRRILRRPYADVDKEYKVFEEELGRGNAGVIRLCESRASGKHYACKTLSKAPMLCREDADDVLNEVQMLQLVKGHPAIVGVEATFEDAKSVHIIMELCEGGELFDRVVEKERYSEPEAAAVCANLVGALSYLHRRGVMHRDVKPENILLCSRDDDVSIKLTDFGVATSFQQAPFHERLGSPYYLAPEVLAESYSWEADIWSAGAVLYVMLAGVPPFWGETNEEIFASIREEELDLESDPWPEVSEDAKDLVRRMLEREPRRRLDSLQVLEHAWIQKHNRKHNF